MVVIERFYVEPQKAVEGQKFMDDTLLQVYRTILFHWILFNLHVSLLHDHYLFLRILSLQLDVELNKL